VLAALLVLTLPITALFGVVLESPFGAIPYFWAVGYLCGRTTDLTGTSRSDGGVEEAPVEALDPLPQ
jgi:hypothetical protein